MRRPRLTYANVLSTICLFLLLGGGAWAAKTQLAKNSVGTRQLKNGAVTGAKVKDGSLTGADVNSSTLGQVPSAATAGTAANADHATSADTATRAGAAGSADHATGADHATTADSATRAGDAGTLDGLGPSAFLPAGRIQRIAYEAHWQSEPIALRTFLTVGPLTLGAECVESQEGGARNLLQIVATAPTGATMDYSQIVGASTKVGVYELEPSGTVVERLVSTETEAISASVTFVYRDSARTISIPLSIFVSNTSDFCRVSGDAVVAE
jgi:hypothetical protein